jgi:hypothetical protein
LASCGGLVTRQTGAIHNRAQVSNLPHKPKLTHYAIAPGLDKRAILYLHARQRLQLVSIYLLAVFYRLNRERVGCHR